MNPWLFMCIISFFLFILLADWKRMKWNIWGGMIAAGYQMVQNILFVYTNMIRYKQVDLYLPPSVIFNNDLNIFSIGIAFFMGVLFFQYIPRNRYLQIAHGLAWTLFFAVSRLITQEFGMLTQINYNNIGLGHGMLILTFSLMWVKSGFFNKSYMGEKNDYRTASE